MPDSWSIMQEKNPDFFLLAFSSCHPNPKIKCYSLYQGMVISYSNPPPSLQTPPPLLHTFSRLLYTSRPPPYYMYTSRITPSPAHTHIPYWVPPRCSSGIVTCSWGMGCEWGYPGVWRSVLAQWGSGARRGRWQTGRRDWPGRDSVGLCEHHFCWISEVSDGLPVRRKCICHLGLFSVFIFFNL